MGDRIRLITLAPEIEGAIPFVEQCVKNGIVIGIGHTNAPEEVIESAFRAGARISCHLGNGAHAVLPRHRNPIQKQLSMDGLMASIIVDGIHLPDYVVKNIIRAKGADRVLLTTDSMAGAARPCRTIHPGRSRGGGEGGRPVRAVAWNSLSGGIDPDNEPGGQQCHAVHGG